MNFISKRSPCGKIVLAIAAALIIASSLVIFDNAINKTSQSSAPLSQTNRPGKTTVKSPFQEESKPVQGAKVNSQPDRSLVLGKYLEFFDSICPLFSESEENLLLDNSKRSPEMLVALALMRSKRSSDFLKEALSGSSPPSIAIYGALSRAVFDGDKKALAVKLGGSYGNLALASQLIKDGADKGAILKAFQSAALSKPQLVPWMRQIRDIQEAALIAVGRDPSNARARAQLEFRGSSETVMLNEVDRYFTASGAIDDVVQGPEVAMWFVELNQQLIENPGFDLDAYSSAYVQKTKYLQVLQTRFKLDSLPFMETSISQAILDAKQEYEAAGDILIFSHDKAGIFMRLPIPAGASLLQEVAKTGELTAFRNALNNYPQIFSDPNFAPQGFNPESWASLVSAKR